MFNTGRSDTVNLVLGNPSVLLAPLELLRTKLQDLALLLLEPPAMVVELLLRSPLLNSRSSRWLAQNIQELAQDLQVRCTGSGMHVVPCGCSVRRSWACHGRQGCLVMSAIWLL